MPSQPFHMRFPDDVYEALVEKKAAIEKQGGVEIKLHAVVIGTLRDGLKMKPRAKTRDKA
jgi:hypothetical protein